MATYMGKKCFVHLMKNHTTNIYNRSSWLQFQRQNQTTAVVTNRKDVKKKDKPAFVIPKKKKRDSLSVLKRLAATVQKDPTAADYLFIDDPYLIPINNEEKKIYALSKSGGRKAARYIVDNYPEAFRTDMFHDVASVPHIEAFMPKKIKYEYHEPCEAALSERIEMRKVKDAIDMYNQMKEQGLEVSEETHLSLLHLLTVFNSKDPKPDPIPEEFKFRKVLGLNSKVFHKTWQTDGPAEQVFADLPVKTPEAYCSLIKGFCKYLQTDGAFKLYNEMVEKDLPIDVNTYNALIYACIHYFTNDASRWPQVLEILQHMKAKNVLPTVDTFLNVLLTLKMCRRIREKEVFKVLNEMKAINIEPTLGIFKLVNTIVYADENSAHPFIYEVIDYLQDKEFEVSSMHDCDFFLSAMEACYRNLHDVQLAHKVDALLNSKDYYKFMSDVDTENLYSWKYFSLVCQFESIEKIMGIYQRLVPNTWAPRYSGYLELFNAVDLHDGFHYLPAIWSDLLMVNFLGQIILKPFFKLIVKKKHEPELQQKFADIVDSVIEKWHNMSTTTRIQVGITGPMIGDFIIIKLHADRFDEAWSLFELYKARQKTFSATITELSIQMLVDECIKMKDSDKAIKCIQLMAKEEFPSLKIYEKKVSEEMELTDLERQHVDVI